MEKLRLKIFDMKESLVNRLEPIKHLSRITKIKSTIISKKFEIIGTSICIVSPKSAYREEKALRNEIFELEKQLSRTYESLGKKAENSGNLKKAEKYYKKSGFSMVGFYASHKEEDVYFKRKLAN